MRYGNHLERGRDSYRRRAWGEAYESLSRADGAAPLHEDDLELLALSAYLTGRDDEYLGALERAHHAHVDAGERVRAARCAFWLGLRLGFRGESGRATGWLGRAQRLLDGEGNCVEQGYLLLPLAEQAADCEAGYATAARAAEIGERFRDADLIACARHLQGHFRLGQGRVAEGLALLDEVMVGVIAGELSPLMTGLLYCSVIDACRAVYALGRAREWTSALARWCEEQPEMVAFTGVCRVHRAEILQLSGAWPDAIDEARRARERCQGVNRQSAGAASYRQGELHRLRGEHAAAEEAYRLASEQGCEPQPGLALLRLAQGRVDAAAAAIRRAVGATTEPSRRATLLPAYVEVLLCAGDVEEARHACDELDELARRFDADALRAIAAHARGAVELAADDARAALGPLRRAWETWHRLDAPYEAARARVLLGLACRALGDEDGGRLELDAARRVFEQLGAAPDIARIASLDEPSGHVHGLTARELQVLRLVAAGRTNKAIAGELCLSEKTIDRHLSNIFNKLDVSSRTAATAYAYEHKLVGEPSRRG